MLRGLSVPELYIRWLQACICNIGFTVGYNGKINGYFKGKRGLRQGDPLSPYLFVLAMNYLSLLLNQYAENETFSYHFKCKESKLTHMCFADDLLVFVEGSLSSVNQVLSIINNFRERSGLLLASIKLVFQCWPNTCQSNPDL